MASKRRAAQLLRSGAKRIETYGHVKGTYGSKSSGFCIQGSYGLTDSVGWSDDKVLAAKALKKVLGQTGAVWNDLHTTTKDHVVRKMRQVARLLEHGLQVSVKENK